MKIYKCDSCDTLIEVVYPVQPELKLEGFYEIKAGAVDAAFEKHVPVLEVVEKKLVVKVGSVTHPMTEAHYITAIWAEFEDGSVEKSTLIPANAPETAFDLKGRTGKITVYEYCNLHGLWKAEIVVES